MKRIALLAVAVGAFAMVAAPAYADTQPTARDVQAAVDTYFASAQQDANLVGGAGSAGYDSGFWIRGGDFMLRMNLTLQARFEYFDYDENEEGLAGGGGQVPVRRLGLPGGDLSGFSLPRATLKFSGTAPCNIRYYLEMEFGHEGYFFWAPLKYLATQPAPAPWIKDTYNYDNSREAWIEWGMSDLVNFRMGQIKTPNTRQMMVAPELQQFVDISMASAVTGSLMPGYTDRNRDHGFMLHGAFGCNGEFSYMLAVTNGDGGDSVRNVLNHLTSDNLAFSGRLNWAFLAPIGYTEGATGFDSCSWYGELGAWAHYYADRIDYPHTALYDRLVVGGDLALGYGGFSFTGAFTYVDLGGSDIAIFFDEEWIIYMAQIGYHFPNTAWELAVRYSHYDRTLTAPGGGVDVEPTTDEFAAAINYYLNGHANKLTLDAAFIQAEQDQGLGGGYYDQYAGVPLGFGSDGDSMLIRFQWQLAL